MTFLSASLIAMSLIAASDDAPPASPKTGEIAPETRVEPKSPANDGDEVQGRILLGLRLHGPRFQLQGEGTQEKPLFLDLPVGDFLKLRIVYPANGGTPLSEGALY